MWYDTWLDPFAEANAEDSGAGTKEYVHVRVQQRNGRKSLTTVQGLKKEFSYSKILKDLKKEFCCNGTVVEDPELGQVCLLFFLDNVNVLCNDCPSFYCDRKNIYIRWIFFYWKCWSLWMQICKITSGCIVLKSNFILFLFLLNNWSKSHITLCWFCEKFHNLYQCSDYFYSFLFPFSA